MDRRAYIAIVGASIIVVPIAVRAQQSGRLYRIGVLGPTPMAASSDEAFRQGLAELGYQNGRNLMIEYRDGEGQLLSGLAADLVRLHVDVIYARGPAAVVATRDATRTIPIVAIDLESDPVAMGFVKGLAQPGGNITGVFLDLPELGGKQLQLLKEIEPSMSRVAVLGDPVLNGPQFRAMELAARALAIEVQREELRAVKDFDHAVDAAKKARARAILILSSPFVFSHRAQFGALAIARRMPAVSMFTEFAEAGGLLAYGPSVTDAQRRCGVYVGRILQGAKPGEMPIERPQTFQMAVNLKTAKALGLTVPPSVLGRADKVIE